MNDSISVQIILLDVDGVEYTSMTEDIWGCDKGSIMQGAMEATRGDSVSMLMDEGHAITIPRERIKRVDVIIKDLEEEERGQD